MTPGIVRHMRGQRIRWGAAVVSAALLGLLVGCTSTSTPRIVTSDVSELSGMEALLRATLRADPHGCVYAETDGESVTLVWPEGYSVSGDAESFEIRDADGEVVAQSGAALDIGGGGVDSAKEEWDGLDCATESLWMVGGIRPSP